MQYSVLGSDGNQYGPVDLMTLKNWAQEGRVTPNSQITDHLGNRTMTASSMPELGFSSSSNPYGNTPAPPNNYSTYPRLDQQPMAQPQGTKLWGIIFWLVLAIIFSLFTKAGGIIVSGWNIIDAFQAKSRHDPKAGACLAVAIGGFVLVLIWTIIKYQTHING